MQGYNDAGGRGDRVFRNVKLLRAFARQAYPGLEWALLAAIGFFGLGLWGFASVVTAVDALRGTPLRNTVWLAAGVPALVGVVMLVPRLRARLRTKILPYTLVLAGCGSLILALAAGFAALVGDGRGPQEAPWGAYGASLMVIAFLLPFCVAILLSGGLTAVGTGLLGLLLGILVLSPLIACAALLGAGVLLWATGLSTLVLLAEPAAALLVPRRHLACGARVAQKLANVSSGLLIMAVLLSGFICLPDWIKGDRLLVPFTGGLAATLATVGLSLWLLRRRLVIRKPGAGDSTRPLAC